MKPWTRTLNLDDAHTLLALADEGRSRKEWIAACHEVLPELSMERRRELIRLLRDGFLEWTDTDRIDTGVFLDAYADAPAMAQIDLVQVQWALSHPLSLVAADALLTPRQGREDRSIPLGEVDDLVGRHIDSPSSESRRKTRTVLLAALEGVGSLSTRGTGAHRTLWASTGSPHPAAFAYMLRRECDERGIEEMSRSDAVAHSVAVRLTQCGIEHATACLDWARSSDA